MISRFEFVQAGRNHIPNMEDPAEMARVLDVDEEELGLFMESILLARKPEDDAKSKESAYKGGFLDGFFMGIKAQLAEYFVMCERCGTPVWRGEDDPVPEDYSPLEHSLICHECMPAVNAHLN